MDQNIQNYKIKRETMTLIADKLRRVVGKTTPLTPAEIAYYIDKIIFTPQSYANSELSNFLVTSSNLQASLPEIFRGQTVSTLYIPTSIFSSVSSGSIPEIDSSIAVSDLITFLTSSEVTGILQEA